jgi:hypothetical protein
MKAEALMLPQHSITLYLINDMISGKKKVRIKKKLRIIIVHLRLLGEMYSYLLIIYFYLDNDGV